MTLQPTALVHEAWMRLNKGTTQDWQGRAHFFAAAAEAMRRILIEDARRKQRLKHGRDYQRQPLDPDQLPTTQSPAELLALHDALEKFSQEDSTKAELVKLRYFAGLTLVEAAAMLGISRTTAARYWAYARAWLFDELKRGRVSNEDASCSAEAQTQAGNQGAPPPG